MYSGAGIIANAVDMFSKTLLGPLLTPPALTIYPDTSCGRGTVTSTESFIISKNSELISLSS